MLFSDYSKLKTLIVCAYLLGISLAAVPEPFTVSGNSEENDAPLRWKIPVIILVVILVIAVTAAIIYVACARYNIYRRCYLETETQEEDEIGRLLGEATTYVTIKEKRPLNKQDLKLQGFVNFLEDSYKKYSVLKLFPCNEDVNAEKLHTDCQCLVTSEDGKEFTVSSDKCFTQAVLSLKPRVLLTGETGYGKSTLIYNFVDQWRKEINKTLLVFYLELTDGEMGVPIEDIIHNMMSEENRLSKEEIHKIIQKEPCMFLFDIRTYTSANHAVTGHSNDLEQRHGRLTTYDLLNRNFATELVNINVLAAIDGGCIDETLFPPPYFKIKLRGFSEHNTTQYIEQTFDYFDRRKPKDFSDARQGMTSEVMENQPLVNEDSEETTIDLTQSSRQRYPQTKDDESLKRVNDVAISSKTNNEHINNVKRFLRSHEILEEFCKTPFWLTAIVHTKMANVMDVAGHAEDIEKVTHLTQLCIEALIQRYLFKVDSNSVDSIWNIITKLGKFACENRLLRENQEVDKWEDSIGKVDLQVAVQIGLLQVRKECLSGEQTGSESNRNTLSYLIKYRHRFIMGYCVGKFLSERENVREVLQQYTDEELEIFVHFINATDILIDIVFEELNLRKMWTTAIVYLYEVHNMKSLDGPVKVNDTTLSFKLNDFKSRYHQNAIIAYLNNRGERQLTHGTVLVDEDCSLVFLTSCSLPSLDRLVIAKRHLSEEDLLSIVSWASKEVHCFLTVQFVQCQLPDAIGILEELKSLIQEKNTKIERKESDGNILELDTSDGKWNAIQVHADQAQDDVT